MKLTTIALANCIHGPEYVRACARRNEHWEPRHPPLRKHHRCGKPYCNQTQNISGNTLAPIAHDPSGSTTDWVSYQSSAARIRIPAPSTA